MALAKPKRTTRDLDTIDRKLLRALQNDGRSSITNLAALAHLSLTAYTERVRRLERDGYVRGYHAELDPRLLMSLERPYSYRHLNGLPRRLTPIAPFGFISWCHQQDHRNMGTAGDIFDGNKNVTPRKTAT